MAIRDDAVNEDVGSKPKGVDLEQPSGGASERKMEDVPKDADGKLKVAGGEKKKTKPFRKWLVTWIGLVLCVGIVTTLSIYFVGKEDRTVDNGPSSIADPLDQVVFLNSTMGETNGADSSLEKESRITGGHDALTGEFTYFAKLKDCGGVLIAPNVVLTAAHCPRNVGETVRVGGTFAYYYYSRVVEEVSHPNFGWPKEHSNDLKLLRLADDVPSFPNEKTVLLGDGVLTTWYTMIGLGETDSSDEANRLQEVEVNSFSVRTCQEIYGDDFDWSTMFCAGDFSRTRDACEGDAGSPLVDRQVNNRWQWGSPVHIVVGVASWGFDCHNKSLPSVYAKVSNAVPWIESTVCDRWSPKASFCPTPPPTPSPTSSHIPTRLPSESPSQSPSTEDDRIWPRGTTKFVVAPFPGTDCDGTLELRARRNNLGFGNDNKGKQEGCNGFLGSNQEAYEVIINRHYGDIDDLIEMYYNGNNDSCWSTKRGVYVHGIYDGDTPPDKCIQLRRKSTKWWGGCSNKQGYHFNVHGFFKHDDGKISILDLNIKDNGSRECANFYTPQPSESVSPSFLPTLFPTPSPSTQEEGDFPKESYKFSIVPEGGYARCEGLLSLAVGRDEKGILDGCNGITASNQSSYNIVIPGAYGDLENLDMWYNGHSKSCWTEEPAWFHIRGKAEDGLPTSSPPDTCMEIHRYKKSLFRCSNEENFIFSVQGWHKDSTGKISLLDIEMDKGRVRSCDEF